MKKNTTEKPGVFHVIVQKAFNKTQADYGVSEQDVFWASVAFAAIGLMLVNISSAPASIISLGWSLMVIGIVSMVLIREIL